MPVTQNVRIREKTMAQQFESIGDKLLVRAPAKINLSLLIAGKRDDGFHEIETIMAKIDWYDELLFEKGTTKGIELICQGTHWAPDGEENLVFQACRMLLDHADVNRDMKVTLTKNIPAGAGLGGGSSDAAAALLALNKFAKLNVPIEILSEIAAKLGSDIAFFLGGPLANCCGRGEKIGEINQIFDFKAILFLPDIAISTKRVYDNYAHCHDLYLKRHEEIQHLLGEKRIDLVSKMCENMLDKSCFDLHPELTKLKSRIQSLGYGPVCLSGSGSTMYSLITDLDHKKVDEFVSTLKENVDCESLIVNSNRW